MSPTGMQSWKRSLQDATSARVFAASLFAFLLIASTTAKATEFTFSFHPPKAPANLFLAGSFNNWNPAADRMLDPDGDGIFQITLNLADGSYQYKFVADGSWMTDPVATEFADDGYGGKNSIVHVGAGAATTPKSTPATPAATPSASPGATPSATPAAAAIDVTFQYQPVIGGARDIFLAGSFNNWSADGARLSDADGDGTFEVTLPLAPGRYEYKFVVQGTWMTDDNAAEFADDGFGGKNSVVQVGGAGGGAGSRDAEGLFNVVFSHQTASRPGTIVLAGTFNQWSTSATPMADADGDGTYDVTLVLPGGEYQYKFVVDGNWVTDQKAESFTDDGFGGKNSVIRVDARLGKVEMKVSDGELFTEGITHSGSLAERNVVSGTEVIFRARAYKDDIEGIDLVWRPAGSAWQRLAMSVFSEDVALDHWEANLRASEPLRAMEYGLVYHDGPKSHWLGTSGWSVAGRENANAAPPADFRPFAFDPATAPRFSTPEWVRDGIFYQIFPDRFMNGDPKNDPKFDAWYYENKTHLPRVGKLNGEYYHLVKDWSDIAGLKTSPYRSDGKPDYFSFYGGDIEGVRQKLPYLRDLGITILYFNPVFQAKSNHKYDAAAYEAIDPALGDVRSFRAFVDEAHAMGIRVVLDTVFNHTGSAHWAFKDCVDKGPQSEYWSWFEWKKWPLPTGDPSTWKAEEYYECWWGFGDLPDVNFDLKNTKTVENGIQNLADAEPNQPVVDYLLKSVRMWLTDLDVDGFRLDVPGDVPTWFWEMFAKTVRETKPDAYILAELWGDASDWVGRGLVDATMNYRYFRDPVTKWIAQGKGSAAEFDRELGPGRFVYPPQAQQAMMNLLDSHDTVRFRTQAGGDVRRLQLAAIFQMTYVGAPHIYYGNEIAMEGGGDPDCRRPFDWKAMEEPERKATLDLYRRLAAIRKESTALRRGGFRTLLAKEQIYAYARQQGEETIVVVLNNSRQDVQVAVPIEKVAGSTASFRNLLAEGTARAENGALPVSLAPFGGAIYRLER